MDQIVGCGIDIEELDRFKKHIPAQGDIPAFCQLVFTEKEIDHNRNILPHLTFPLAFSCKEAVFKAFGVSWTNSRISWKDIEIIFSGEDDLRDYTIQLKGHAHQLFQGMKCSKLESSFEYTDHFVIFQVILLSN